MGTKEQFLTGFKHQPRYAAHACFYDPVMQPIKTRQTSFLDIIERETNIVKLIISVCSFSTFFSFNFFSFYLYLSLSLSLFVSHLSPFFLSCLSLSLSFSFFPISLSYILSSTLTTYFFGCLAAVSIFSRYDIYVLPDLDF